MAAAGVNHSKISAIADEVPTNAHILVGVNHSKISAIADVITVKTLGANMYAQKGQSG